MFLRRTTRALVALLVLTLGLVGVGLGTASAAPEVDASAVRTLYYDSSRAGEFKEVIDEAAVVWNNHVKNVKLQKGSSRANIVVIADNGWPRAQTTSLGNGRVYMGRQAVQQGYDTLRIATHELGHILGLPDRKPGPCSSLMSGSSAGTECRNPNPNAREISEVERNFRRGAVVAEALPEAVRVF
ncbi:snapalysin family zinc-dependent metalloprotease [Streptoalloteichus hindustanus]|uniref:Extracellular small neutral protease n=1 Tax=Streptoalloteichus hindustanus TaxID=2017 RepID=A0A1M4XM80_STRHI|nr:snapalysin family zinc-dependent metalloprotease [Streptoalloteichus hindustanus]SHE94717.1 snapalysin [Streptoalloteichus hindustanus]